MYVLVRADLAPGAQLAQAVHAAIGLAQGHDDLPDTVVVLSVADESSLITQAGTVSGGELFREPDLGNEATAYAVVSDGATFSALCLAGGAMV